MASCEICTSLACSLSRLGAGVDRFECFVTATQFFFEGLSTTMFLVVDDPATAATPATLAFVFGLGAIFLPMVLGMYDGLIVPIITRLRTHERVTCKTWLITILGVILAVPAAILAVFGIQLACFDMLTAAAEETVGQEEAMQEARKGVKVTRRRSSIFSLGR